MLKRKRPVAIVATLSLLLAITGGLSSASAVGAPVAGVTMALRYWGEPAIPPQDSYPAVSVYTVLGGVDMLDANNGWAVGSIVNELPAGAPKRPFIVRTTAGGSTIATAEVTAASSTTLSGVSAVDATHAWAVGSGGTILKWDGTQWTPQVSPAGFAAGLNAVDFADASTGFAVGADRRAISTADGGTNWVLATYPVGTGGSLNSVKAVSATDAWAVGDAGVAYHYTGAGWSATSPPASGRTLWAVDFFDAQHGVIVGDNATVLVTRDGGANWRPCPVTLPVGYDASIISFRSVHMSGPETIVAGGNYGIVARSVDGGGTWVSGQADTGSIAGIDWQILSIAGAPGDPTKLMFAGYGATGGTTPNGFIFTGIQPVIAPVPPAAPTGLTASPGASGPSVVLAWTPNAFNETGYRVYRSDGGGAYNLVQTLAARVATWTDATVGWGTPYAYRVVAYDAAGESAPASASVGKLDTTPPTTTSNLSPGVWYRTPTVNVTLTADDHGQSGVAQTRFLGGAGPEKTGFGPFPVSGEGVTPVKFGSTDNVGNVETTSTTSVSIDSRAPVTTDDNKATYIGAATITLTSYDPAPGSGVAGTTWTLDGDSGSGAVVRSTVLGPHTLLYASTDRAGNKEVTSSPVTFVVNPTTPPPDTTPPTTTFTALPAGWSSGWVDSDVTFMLTGTDNFGGSGVSATYYELNGGTQTTYLSTPVTVSTEGQTIVTYWSEDVTPNTESPHKTALIRIDRSDPTVSSNAEATYPGPATIKITATDMYSGVASISYKRDRDATTVTVPASSLTAGTYTLPAVTSPGAHSLSYFSTDNVGRTSAAVPKSYTITQASPVPQNVYRFFNLRAGVHFYTASEAERDNVINTLGNVYRFEGPSYAVNLANPSNTQPLYRFYNFKAGVHFYTANEAEKQNVLSTLSGVYRFEGPAYYVSTTATNAFPVYRFYNLKAGVHFYTSSEAERDNVINTLGAVYRFEGVGYYVGK